MATYRGYTTRPMTADALRCAALDSIKISPDANGIRPGDPLRDLIPDNQNATAEVLALVLNITGRCITRDPGAFLNTAPAARAALRRWAQVNREDYAA